MHRVLVASTSVVRREIRWEMSPIRGHGSSRNFSCGKLSADGGPSVVALIREQRRANRESSISAIEENWAKIGAIKYSRHAGYTGLDRVNCFRNQGIVQDFIFDLGR